MFITILVVLFSLVVLMAFHELGHFLLAKKFGVKVPEFGIGYPPRIWGKKIGETIYSINWLPFGAFVKIMGEDRDSNDPRSFTKKPLWQRALILLGGGLAFWLIAIIILTLASGIWGVPTSIPDDLSAGFDKAEVRVLAVAADTPAQEAGIMVGDTFVDFGKVQDIKDFINSNLGEEISLSLARGDEVLELALIPRTDWPENEGPIGIALARVADLKTVWYKAPGQAVEITYQQTKAIPIVLGKAIIKKFKGEPVVGVQLVGPIGVGKVMGQALGEGIGSYLVFIAMIAIWLALFNFLPIPALDGGRLLFIVIEAVRGKPVSVRIEQRITATFFFLLIALMVIVTLKDIIGLF